MHVSFMFPIRSLDQIPPSILPHFKEAAQQLIIEKGAEEALAAALAHISGSKEIVSRSVLSGMSVRYQGTCDSNSIFLFINNVGTIYC